MIATESNEKVQTIPAMPTTTDTSARAFATKYLLQSHDSRGHIISLAKYDYPVTPSEAIEQFGSRDYVLKRISPRFAVEWKHKTPDGTNNAGFTGADEVQKLKRETRYHKYAIIGLGAIDLIGFGLTHFRFNSSEDRLSRLEAVAATFSASRLSCPHCSNSLHHMLQQFCGECGTQLGWPKDQLQLQAISGQKCNNCNRETILDQKFCTSCGHSLIAVAPTFSGARFKQEA